MPLKSGPSSIGPNIRELMEHGTRPRSKKQIVALALSKAGVNKLKGGKK